MRSRITSDRVQYPNIASINQVPDYANATDLTQEFTWCAAMIQARLAAYFKRLKQEEEGSRKGGLESDIYLPKPPVFNLTNQAHNDANSGVETSRSYAQFIHEYQLDTQARLALILALASDIKPDLYDALLMRNEVTGLAYFEFGVQLYNDRPYATGATLAFILSGAELETYFHIQDWLQALVQKDKHALSQRQVLEISSLNQVLALDLEQANNVMQMPINLTDSALYRFTTGRAFRPESSHDFPAQYLSTDLEWEHLILPEAVMKQVSDIQYHIFYGEQLMQEWELEGKIRPGYRALFYGPPGTGKTLTASLLGRATQHDVYRIDLSLMVSKYIGETEKNLSKVFNMAEDKKWILLFDEADALFGKRNRAMSANDQFANQNVAYLLQRIEAFNGVAILATNLKDNLDEAFLRRFESIIYFPLPGPEERLSLWQKGFSAKAKLEDKIDLSWLAHKYPLSGASIMNVVRYASMQSIRRAHIKPQLGKPSQLATEAEPVFDIKLMDLETGIGKELEASGDSRILSKGRSPF
ncbi:ATP-binding protein [Marinomonas sp. S3726]|uniref:ATP-binding protein n=1 Tax=Marinomonas sp. S3726 TaxID=579484 RepID=UPI000697B650|nr:ATP-binding protein [Marinomonas sp. S3726]